jgi:hypothetical protein
MNAVSGCALRIRDSANTNGFNNLQEFLVGTSPIAGSGTFTCHGVTSQRWMTAANQPRGRDTNEKNFAYPTGIDGHRAPLVSVSFATFADLPRS